MIYCHFMVLLSFCVIKQYYHEDYKIMAVNYNGKKFYNIGPWWQNTMVIYHDILTL